MPGPRRREGPHATTCGLFRRSRWGRTCGWLAILLLVLAAAYSREARRRQQGTRPAPLTSTAVDAAAASEAAASDPSDSSAAVAEPASHPAMQPRHKFLMFFSGHQGSSALADMLGELPEVFIPGFEPLDAPGLLPAQKLAFMEATFTFPPEEAGFASWRRELQPLAGMRVDRNKIQSFQQLAGKSVAGFKMRPYTLQPQQANTGDSGSSDSGSSDSGSSDSSSASSTGSVAAAGQGAAGNSPATAAGSQMHTAMSGLSPAVVKALLKQYNVSVLLTLRRNTLKEALSWYKARDLGIKQFNSIREAAAVARSTGSTRPTVTEVGAAAAPGGNAGATGKAVALAGSLQQGSPPTAAAAAVSVNVTRVLRWLKYTAQVNEELRRGSAYFARPTLTIWYEDFLEEPLREAQRAAEFIGADPSALRLSAKFKKSGPDVIHEWVLNYAELCRALEGSPYYTQLEVSACPPPSHSHGDHNSSMHGSHDSHRGSSRDGRGDSAPPTALPPLEANLPIQLLDNWCVPKDKQATGWADLTDAACMQRFLARQEAALVAVRNGSGTLLFKHVHKAGGSTLCKLAQRNMAAEAALLPGRKDWDTNCVPYQAFLGPHPAVGGGAASAQPLPANAGADSLADAESSRSSGDGSQNSSIEGSTHLAGTRRLQAAWLGGACWLGFLTPAQLRVLPHHFRPLTFIASEGPLPDVMPLDAPAAMLTMLRHPLDRVLSSYRWWQFMMERMPQAPAECHAYIAPANASLEQWLEAYPDNWMTRELVGRTALYQRQPLTEADLRVAVQRLRYFAAVLIMEEPEGSMALLRQLFGWREVGWEGHRAGSRHGSNATAELAGPLVQQLLQRNQMDLRVYEYGKLLHAAQLQRLGLGGA